MNLLSNKLKYVSILALGVILSGCSQLTELGDNAEASDDAFQPAIMEQVTGQENIEKKKEKKAKKSDADNEVMVEIDDLPTLESSSDGDIVFTGKKTGDQCDLNGFGFKTKGVDGKTITTQIEITKSCKVKLLKTKSKEAKVKLSKSDLDLERLPDNQVAGQSNTSGVKYVNTNIYSVGYPGFIYGPFDPLTIRNGTMVFYYQKTNSFNTTYAVVNTSSGYCSLGFLAHQVTGWSIDLCWNFGGSDGPNYGTGNPVYHQGKGSFHMDGVLGFGYFHHLYGSEYGYADGHAFCVMYFTGSVPTGFVNKDCTKTNV